jgi:hypothetical protein
MSTPAKATKVPKLSQDQIDKARCLDKLGMRRSEIAQNIGAVNAYHLRSVLANYNRRDTVLYHNSVDLLVQRFSNVEEEKLRGHNKLQTHAITAFANLIGDSMSVAFPLFLN